MMVFQYLNTHVIARGSISGDSFSKAILRSCIDKSGTRTLVSSWPINLPVSVQHVRTVVRGKSQVVLAAIFNTDVGGAPRYFRYDCVAIVIC
jgi:hypothetical protein